MIACVMLIYIIYYMYLARTLLCLTLFFSLHSAELPDPTTSLHPQHLFDCLNALLPLLDQAPQNQDLLGRAQMAYVELSFAGPAKMNGIAGPWLDYAEQLSTERQKLRAGTLTTTLADSLPDIWLDIVRGDTVSALANLNRFPEDAQTPAARAARMAITRDIRGIRDQPPESALEYYAYLATCCEFSLKPDDRLSLDDDDVYELFDPLALPYLRNHYLNDSSRDYFNQKSITNVYTDVATMLESPQIPDAIAQNHLIKLVEAFNGTTVSGASRSELIATTNALINKFTGDRVEPLIAAYGICRKLRRGQRGIRNDDGAHQLISYGDVAQWLQDRLYAVAALSMDWHYDNNENRRNKALLIEAAFPGSLLAARTFGRWNVGEQTDSWQRMDDAILRELNDPLGLSPGTALLDAKYLFSSLNDSTIPNFIAIVQNVWPTGLVSRRWGIPDLSCTYWQLHEAWQRRDATSPLAHAAYLRDPYNAQMWLAGRYCDARFPFQNTAGLKPLVERIDAQIDYPTLPIPGVPPSPNLGARWTGWLQFPRNESVTIGFEADKRARLIVGDQVIMHYDGRATMSSERTMTVEAGWLPVTLEWGQGFTGGGIRLLEQDARGEWQPIAASRLAHGANHEPGLEATYWGGCTDEQEQLLRPIDLELLAQMPWQLTWQSAFANAYNESNQFQKAVDLLRPLRAIAPTNREVDRSWMTALAKSQRAENCPDLLVALKDKPCLRDDLILAGSIATMINRNHLQESYAATTFDTSPCCVEGYTIARTAIARCAWDAALKVYSNIKNYGRAGYGSPDDGPMNWKFPGMEDEYAKSIIEITLMQRTTTGIQPNWKELRALSTDNARANPKTTPSTRLFLSWLVGDISWEAAVNLMSPTKHGEEILWYRGLYEVTIGNYDDAKKYFAPMMAHHPTWREAADADGLLFWLAKQSPSQLAALPKAKPLLVRPAEAAEPINF